MTWRQIEAKLLEFAKSEGLAINEHRGESFVHCQHADESMQLISLQELARTIADA